ncbi:GNAT family protein [uncultured Agrococcus sp.]|uniref:GNAT family N-acetyltransferase n=1 Tax=uncultured Agrococcus sp. TaxID=382258 RepID=UPI0025E63AB7|nr:GNAT family protein [uncultured Agrococcus sp.]
MTDRLQLRALRRPEDDDALAQFLGDNEWPFHMRPRPTQADAARRIADGRYDQPGNAAFWITLKDQRIGFAALEDLDDDTPLFDLRLALDARGRGFGVRILQLLTREVFERSPEARRFEGQTREDNVAMRKTFLRAGWVKEAHYREAWPVEGSDPVASVAYAILRRDWETGMTTPVPWGDE